MTPAQAASVFEQSRSRLWGMAYRMLGSVADAEDAVQDTGLKWLRMDHRNIDNPQAWLLTSCTHRCIDVLRSAHRTRMDYVGTWLPEPVVAETATPHGYSELSSSLSMAFLLLLERLKPMERAVYLLREIFDYRYDDIAALLGSNAVSCRKICSRARERLAGEPDRVMSSTERPQPLLDEFLTSLATGDGSGLAALLATDVELWADGGGKVPAALDIISAVDAVTAFLISVWQRFWCDYELRRTTINGEEGLLLCHAGAVVGTVNLEVDTKGLCKRIFVVRNPDKLRHLQLYGN